VGVEATLGSLASCRLRERKRRRDEEEK